MMRPWRILVAVSAIVTAGAAHAQSADVTHGKQVFDKWCAPCHGPGLGKPATAALTMKYNGQKPALLEERTDLTPDVVKYFVRHGVFSMPPSRKTEISDADLGALAAYLSRNTKPAP